jgi:catechol 2,3-dioxygenase-like lactoylglutathione lyase family enzyme
VTGDPARRIPTLASLDIAETLAFYRDVLGFTEEALGD